MRFRAWVLGATACGALLHACATLEPMDGNECGDGVVEPVHGEDCEPVSPHEHPGEACFPPESQWKCRYQCTPGATVVAGSCTAEHCCPPGFGCGRDGVCRLPAGIVEAGETVAMGVPVHLLSADLDSDGAADLLAAGRAEASVVYSNPGRLPATIMPIDGLPMVPIVPAVGHLAGDDAPEALVAAYDYDALMVYRGQADRSLVPTISSPWVLPSVARWPHAVLFDLIPTTYDDNGWPVHAGEELLFIAGTFIVNAGLQSTLDAPVVGGVECSGALMPGSLQHGDLVEDAARSPWDELVYGCCPDGTNLGPIYVQQLRVLREDGKAVWNCAPGACETYQPEPIVAPVPITFSGPPPDGRALGRVVRLTHLNDDPHLDLLVSVDSSPSGLSNCGADGGGGSVQTSPGTSLLYAAYGLGDGHFESNAGPDTLALVLSAETGAPVELPQVVAVGDLNQDGRPDFVAHDGLVLSQLEQGQGGAGGSGGAGGATGHGGEAGQAGAGGAAGSGWTIGTTTYVRGYLGNGQTYDSAVIADLDADGLPDVVATTDSLPGLALYFGAGNGAFNEAPVALAARPEHLTVGDFDGDGLLDVAFAEPDVSDGGAGMVAFDGDSPRVNGWLSLVFGAAQGGAAEVVRAGQLDDMVQILAGSVHAESQDEICDLVVTSDSRQADAERSIAVIEGSSSRQLVAPFFAGRQSLGAPNNVDLGINWSEQEHVVAVAVGELDGAAPSHPDVAFVTKEPLTTVADTCQVEDGMRFPTQWPETLLWLVPSDGEAELDAPAVSFGNALTSVCPGETGLTLERDEPSSADVGRRPFLAAIDLDPVPADGVVRDELVLLTEGALGGGPFRGVVVIAHLRDDVDNPLFDPLSNPTAAESWLAWVPDEPQLTDERFGVDLPMVTEPATSDGFAKAEVVDLDGDGLRDLAAMGWNETTGMRLVLFHNEGTGTLSATAALRYPAVGDDGAVLTFAAFEGDGSPGAELFVLRTNGSAGQARAELLEVDFSEGRLVARPLAVPPALLADTALWAGCASGDFDYDGLDDIAVSTSFGVQLLYGTEGH